MRKKSDREKIRKEFRRIGDEREKNKYPEDILFDNFLKTFEEFHRYVENTLKLKKQASKIDRLMMDIVSIYHQEIKNK